MKMTFGIAGALLLLTGISAAVPSEKWNITFGGKGEESASSVRMTSDGGLIIAARLTNLSNMRINTWLIKTDANGIQHWNKTLLAGSDNWAESVEETRDGGFILAGSAVRDGPGGEYNTVVLIKTDEKGTQQWYRTYGSARNNPEVAVDHVAKSVKQTSDGGYVIAGRSMYVDAANYKWSRPSDNINAWLVRFDANGSYMWSMTIPDGTEANSAQQTLFGGFIAAGKIRIKNSAGGGIDENKAILVKTDSFGNLQWIKKFGDNVGDSVFNSVFQTSDRGYIMAGATKSYYGGFDILLIKTDADGNELWKKTYGGSGDDRAYSVVETSDLGYVLAGWTEPEMTRDSDVIGDRDAWIIKTDANGVEQWSKKLGGKNSTDEAYSILQTSEGDYIFAGKTRSYGKGGSDAWLVKLSEDLPVNQTSPSISAEQVTAARTVSMTSMAAPATVKDTPGFSTILLPTGVLTIAYLMRKKDID